jgi:hypothetical protein
MVFYGGWGGGVRRVRVRGAFRGSREEGPGLGIDISAGAAAIGRG